MIRGTTAQFKFHMPYSFSELCIIEATFWQPGNPGTTQAPLPIVRIYNRHFLEAPTVPSDDYDWVDETKVYSYGGKYYKKEKGVWNKYDTIAEITTDDGLTPEGGDNDSKTILVSLTAEETMRFSDQRKGYVQVRAYCENKDITFASKPERFMVYPVVREDVFGDIGQSVKPSTGVQILDAGELE